MPEPVVDPSPLPSREFRPLAPEDAQEASYFAASARIASLRLRLASILMFMVCFYHSLFDSPRGVARKDTGRWSERGCSPAAGLPNCEPLQHTALGNRKK